MVEICSFIQADQRNRSRCK